LSSLREKAALLSLTFGCLTICLVVGLVVGLVVSLVVSLASIDLAHAQTPDDSPNAAKEVDEAEAQGIDRMLMCPVCPAESIDQAQVPLARQMRQRVREMLAEGASRSEILDYFADRYGLDVLASPPKSGLNLLAWILPIAGVLAALTAGGLVIRAMTVRNGEGVSASSSPYIAVPDRELEPYLAAVDRRLALTPDAAASTEPTGSTESNPAEGQNGEGLEDSARDEAGKSDTDGKHVS
jgi:cytochrome c-type biogenesis protein CcmH